MRWGVAGLLVVACACGAGFSAKMPALPKRDQAKTGQRPNVVLIVMDTVRADHTSVYGYDRDTTPFLRELAKEATLYTRAFAVSDFTLPTHASMFTGLYPRTHGAYYAPPNYPNGLPLSQRFTTMAEVLQANGYRAAGIVANAGYLSTSMGFSQGFELFDSRLPERVAAPSRSPYLRRRVHELLDRFVSTADFEPTTRRAQEINHEAETFLNQVDGPFFLFLNYMDAHNPYAPPPPFDRQYPCSYPTIERAERARAAMEPVLTGKRRPPAGGTNLYRRPDTTAPSLTWIRKSAN
jgi:arylsulfatase A-like enzyme